MEQPVGMERPNNMKTISLISTAISFFIFYGCSNETTGLPKSSQTPAVVVTPSRTPVTAATKTPDGDGGRHPVHRIKNGGEFCENYLLKKIAKEKATANRIVKLKAFNVDDETLSPKLKKWLERMDETQTSAYELQHGEKKALLISSYSREATGLSSSYKSWLIQYDNHTVEFFSFSSEPKLIFFDKDDLLNYYSVDYSNELAENRNWNNPIFDILLYRVNLDGQSQLVSKEQNIKCE